MGRINTIYALEKNSHCTSKPIGAIESITGDAYYYGKNDNSLKRTKSIQEAKLYIIDKHKKDNL